MLMYWLLETTSASPRATCRPASVTMNGSSRNRVEIEPWRAPKAAPTARTASSVGSRPQPTLTIIVAVNTLDRLSNAPTERSMPAVMMTKVMPTEMMPVSEMARMMLAILSSARKRMWPWRTGEKMTPPITTRTRPIRLWKRTASDQRSILGFAFVSSGVGLAPARTSDTGHLLARRRRQYGMLVDAAVV